MNKKGVYLYSLLIGLETLHLRYLIGYLSGQGYSRCPLVRKAAILDKQEVYFIL